MVTSIIFTILVYAILNRLAGGGLAWKKVGHQYGGQLRGRAIYYAAPLAGLLTLFSLPVDIAVMGAISFLVWRILGWYNAIDAGTNTETPLRDFAVMSARGLMFFPIVAWLIWKHMHPLPHVLGLAVVCLGIGAAYHLAWHLPAFKRLGGDGVQRAEYLAGAVLGTYLAVLGNLPSH